MIILQQFESHKAQYGKCIYNGKIRFFKKIFEKDMFLREIKGYDKICDFLHGPKRIAIDYNKQIIIYQYIKSIQKKLMHYHLYTPFKRPNIKFLDAQLKHLKTQKESTCPNINFFKHRLHFLKEYSTNLPILNKQWQLNDKCFYPQDLFDNIYTHLNQEKSVLAILTQGDPSAVNILNDGRVIDYEIAGYNSAMGEVAVFISTILYSGYYYFIKYASGEYLQYTNVYKKYKDNISVQYLINDSVKGNYKVKFPRKNKKLAVKYLHSILKAINLTQKQELEKHLKYYLAFRLLTPKNLAEMTEQDIVLTILIVFDIIDNVHTLEDLIDFINN